MPGTGQNKEEDRGRRRTRDALKGVSSPAPDTTVHVEGPDELASGADLRHFGDFGSGFGDGGWGSVLAEGVALLARGGAERAGLGVHAALAGLVVAGGGGSVTRRRGGRGGGTGGLVGGDGDLASGAEGVDGGGGNAGLGSEEDADEEKEREDEYRRRGCGGGASEAALGLLRSGNHSRGDRRSTSSSAGRGRRSLSSATRGNGRGLGGRALEGGSGRKEDGGVGAGDRGGNGGVGIGLVLADVELREKVRRERRRG